MLKTSVTRKELYNHYGKKHVIIIQSRDIADMFIPTSYWTGVYGWNMDVYFGRENAYVFGYRPCGVRWDGTLEELINKMELDGVEKK